MVRQIMANLIGNAFKFSSKCAEPQVEIGAVTNNGVVEFFVRDNGAGEILLGMHAFEHLEQLVRVFHVEPGTVI